LLSTAAAAFGALFFFFPVSPMTMISEGGGDSQTASALCVEYSDED
jgi:hypothetical protein